MHTKLLNGQKVKLRMIGSSKLQQGVVHGDDKESQYIKFISHIPFIIKVNNLANLYEIV